jgi:hypothetical protein
MSARTHQCDSPQGLPNSQGSGMIACYASGIRSSRKSKTSKPFTLPKLPTPGTWEGNQNLDAVIAPSRVQRQTSRERHKYYPVAHVQNECFVSG